MAESHLEAVEARLSPVAVRPPHLEPAGKSFWERLGRALVREIRKPPGGR